MPKLTCGVCCDAGSWHAPTHTAKIPSPNVALYALGCAVLQDERPTTCVTAKSSSCCRCGSSRRGRPGPHGLAVLGKYQRGREISLAPTRVGSVGDLMSAAVCTVDLETGAREAAEQMMAHRAPRMGRRLSNELLEIAALHAQWAEAERGVHLLGRIGGACTDHNGASAARTRIIDARSDERSGDAAAAKLGPRE